MWQPLFYKKTAAFPSCIHGYRANWLINIQQSLLFRRPSSPHRPTFPHSPHTHLLCQRNGVTQSALPASDFQISQEVFHSSHYYWISHTHILWGKFGIIDLKFLSLTHMYTYYVTHMCTNIYTMTTWKWWW